MMLLLSSLVYKGTWQRQVATLQSHGGDVFAGRVETLTLFYCSLLNDPNTSSPANVEASNLYKDNRREYTKRVRETVEKSWED